jgi:hypothetical protein
LAAPDLVTNTLLHRFQEHSSRDAGDLAEKERVTQYMLSLFYVKRVVSGKGGSYFIFWEESAKHPFGADAVQAGAESRQKGGPKEILIAKGRIPGIIGNNRI